MSLSQRSAAILRIHAIHAKHGSVPVSIALNKPLEGFPDGIYTKDSARRVYRDWLNAGVLEQPDDLCGGYKPGPQFMEAVRLANEEKNALLKTQESTDTEQNDQVLESSGGDS